MNLKNYEIYGILGICLFIASQITGKYKFLIYLFKVFIDLIKIRSINIFFYFKRIVLNEAINKNHSIVVKLKLILNFV